MDAADTRTATKVHTPAKIRTGTGKLEPEPEPAMADSDDGGKGVGNTNRYKQNTYIVRHSQSSLHLDHWLPQAPQQLKRILTLSIH